MLIAEFGEGNYQPVAETKEVTAQLLGKENDLGFFVA